MPLSLRFPHRNPDAPRPSLRERYFTLKASAAKVIGRPARAAQPKLPGAGEPSKALAALLAARELAYGHVLHSEAYGLPDLDVRIQAEEEAFRALLHAPLRSDADRAAYALAVIHRQSGALVTGETLDRDRPMAVAYRNLRFGEHGREPEEMRRIGRIGEPDTLPDPVFALIEAHRAAYAAWAPLADIWSEAAPRSPEWDAAETAAAEPGAREAVALNALIAARPTTAAGLWALITYLPEAVRNVGLCTDSVEGAALDALREGALQLGLASVGVAERRSAPQVDAEDPILAAIAASREATAAFDAFENDGPGLGLTPEQSEREEVICSADNKAQAAVWQTVPTTQAGRRALVEFARGHVRRRTHPDGDVDDAGYLFGLIFDAFAAMVEAESKEAPKASERASGGDDARAGLMVYADASGIVRRKPFPEMLSFMAMRLYGVASTEFSRRFAAECGGLDGEGCKELDARLRCELRLDALFALAHQSGKVFVKEQARRNGENLAKLSAEKVDLSRLSARDLSFLYETFQAAKFAWEGVVSRPCCAKGNLSDTVSFEEERADWVMDRINHEITSRSPKGENERDDVLSVRVQHELKCNGRIHDNALLLDVARTWAI